MNGVMLNRKDERVVFMSVVGTVGLKLESGGEAVSALRAFYRASKNMRTSNQRLERITAMNETYQQSRNT